MKVLSLTEPYATLIKNGIKTIETRSWKTSYRGKLYIHASSTKIPKEYKENKKLMSLVDLNELNYGNIICSCELVDCIEMSTEFKEILLKENKDIYTDSSFKENYGWKLENVEVFDKPIETKGKLGLWEYK